MSSANGDKALVVALVVIGFVAPVFAQAPAAAPQATPPAQAGPSDDPFRRSVPVKTKVPEQKDADKPVLIPFPTLEQRRAEFQASRQAAARNGQEEPNGIGQYLVEELAVIGMFHTDEGDGAFVQAVPTNTTFFVTSGTRVYNGEIVSINTGTDFGVGQVVFRELKKYRIRKKENNQVNMVTKAVTSPPAKSK